MIFTKRLAIAGFVAPLIAPVLIILPALFGALYQGNSLVPHLPALQLTFMVGSVVSYGGFALLGGPVIYLLHKRGHLNIPALVVAGLTLGALAFLLFGSFLGHLTGTHGYISAAQWVKMAVVGGFLGGAVALSFALLAGLDAKMKYNKNKSLTTR